MPTRKQKELINIKSTNATKHASKKGQTADLYVIYRASAHLLCILTYRHFISIHLKSTRFLRTVEPALPAHVVQLGNSVIHVIVVLPIRAR